jgi:hypothetical protein
MDAEHYLQAIGQLVAALSTYDGLIKPIIEYALYHVDISFSNQPSYSSYLVAGTPASALSAHCILAVLSVYDEDTSANPSLPSDIQAALPKIAKKVNESIGSDRPNITRPSREAKEILRRVDDELF